MNEEVSALMDGQLGDAQSEGCLKRLKNEPELRASWDVYHLIGDALRGHTTGALTRGFDARLNAEPTVLAPRAGRTRRMDRPVRVALSAAASVAAIGFVGWMSYPFFNTQGDQIATAPALINQASVSPTPAAIPASQNLDDYQMAHQRFAPGFGMAGVAPYVRTVSAQDGQR